MRDGLSQAVERKVGFTKIKLTCQQAKAEGLEFCWVDTCCIDKTSSAELSEAINSMFRWYTRSYVCYAYLQDVEVVAGAATDLWQSKWFTRGWTLQELIAPNTIEFYGSAWMHFGTGTQLADSLSEITGVDIEVLRRERPLKSVCVARRMSWAAGRQTTRVEDTAYSLLGIFDVNMPLLYGEGHKAFHRLQEQIIRESGDDSILAWDYFKPEQWNEDIDLENVLLAPSPDFFQGCRNVRHSRPIAWNDVIDLTNHGLRFKGYYVYVAGSEVEGQHRRDLRQNRDEIVLLNCYSEHEPGLRYALRLQRHGDDGSGQKGYSVCPQAREGVGCQSDTLWAMSMGLYTRLVQIGRKDGHLMGPREINLISKTLSASHAQFRVSIALKSSRRFEFEHVLRPPYSHTEEGDIASLPDNRESGPVVESHIGDSWSIGLSSYNREKLVIVGACIRDCVSNKRFMLLCGNQDADVLPQRTDDGDYGVELRNVVNSYPAMHNYSGALLASARAMHRTRNTPREKNSSLSLPDVGIITATCRIGDFERLTMVVEVTHVAEDQQVPRKERGPNIGQRFSSWMSRADLRTRMDNGD